MKLIELEDRIEETLKKLNAESGGEAECYTVETEHGAALYVKCWSGSSNIGMVSVYHEDADEAAEVIGLDPDMCYAWATGSDGRPTLAEFDTAEDRDLWLRQK